MISVRTRGATMSALYPATGMAVGCARPEGCEDGRPGGDEWLATLSHELRSPLATILFAFEVISDGEDLGPSTRRAFDVAQRQARNAMQLVDDLLDLTAGSRGKLSLHRGPVDLAALVARATETAGQLLTAQPHLLTVSLPPGPVTLDGDALRLEQVLTNLLANAAKYTAPGGHIRLTAEAEGRQVAVRVRDNGRGIEPDQLPRVFELFHRGLDPDVRGTGGLGIGLALVKFLVELHGGSV